MEDEDDDEERKIHTNFDNIQNEENDENEQQNEEQKHKENDNRLTAEQAVRLSILIPALIKKFNLIFRQLQ